MKTLSTLLAGVTALSLSTATLANDHDPMALQAKALQDDVAYDIVEGLTTEVGPRQAGTEAEARARNWAVAKLNALGFSNVRSEAYLMPTWIRGKETAAVVSPFPQALAITALGNSGSTGDKGLTAEVVYFPTLADLVAAPDGSLTGKIAFVSHEMKPTQDGSSYGAFGPARFVGPNIAAKKGAAAIIIRSAGTDHHRNPHTGNTNFEAGVTPIPAGALSIPDAENLARMFARGKAVKLKLVLTPQNIGQQQSGNVIAELPGSDPSLGMIVIACHLDSWDLGTGAIDDASGCAITAAAAKQIMAAGQPKRTIRLLWAGAEEVGIWGGKAYGEAHTGDNHALAMESDFGADRIWRVEFNFPDSATSVAKEIEQALQPLAIGRGTQKASGGADVQSIIANNNLAIIDLQQDGTRYFDLHHTPDDTLDKIDPEQLRQNVAAWSTVLAIVANSDADFTMPAKQ
ncbi:M20/M25/M40 family metallo-hydrolase [Sphingorhabdus sp. M41]|uniref:M20/M25/M40 family metallo-hydrolase n=1 Tax=Sphingorhabdus sp. M41 TaxID=1806885 RepID=UPI00078B66A9|nr:M20/M25/M40 family metallo-hydrolase [Sphingorhabdus sp. M41]AMO71827.1 peptidase M28 [Sphingorhabdus sp. M41]